MAAIVVLSRNLRLTDNGALNAAWDAGYAVAPIYVFPEEPAYGPAATQFLCETLAELHKNTGGALTISRVDFLGSVKNLAKTTGAVAVYEQLDVYPAARDRSRLLREWCISEGLEYVCIDDIDLIGIDEGLLADNKMYEVFTAYWRNAIARYAPFPKPRTASGKFAKVLAKLPKFPDYQASDAVIVRGGRVAAEEKLKNARKIAKDYDKMRDFPAFDGTTMLSAYIQFGVVSPREVVAAIGGDAKSGFVRELIWRSFYYHWAWTQPAILTRAHKFEGLKLPKIQPAKTAWKAFTEGRTGFPIVDAGVRQLKATGWCHNRVRMMLSTFVCRGLGVYWRDGERWMAEQLVDYDQVSNCMGWQWGLAGAPSSQPYFRTMSPWAQVERFDPDCEYIKKWIPELRSVEPKIIRKWNANADYPAPLFDWGERVKIVHAAYKNHGQA